MKGKPRHPSAGRRKGSKNKGKFPVAEIEPVPIETVEAAITETEALLQDDATQLTDADELASAPAQPREKKRGRKRHTSDDVVATRAIPSNLSARDLVDQCFALWYSTIADPSISLQSRIRVSEIIARCLISRQPPVLHELDERLKSIEIEIKQIEAERLRASISSDDAGEATFDFLPPLQAEDEQPIDETPVAEEVATEMYAS